MELAPQNADYTAYLAEMLLLQGPARNQPPPEAERLFRRALELQPGNPQARYYLATLRDMRGDHRGAVDDLIALLREAPAGRALGAAGARGGGDDRATEQYRHREPPAAAPPARRNPAATRGHSRPDPQQMEQARNIPPSQQQQMAQGMVDRLAARLRQNPRDAERLDDADALPHGAAAAGSGARGAALGARRLRQRRGDPGAAAGPRRRSSTFPIQADPMDWTPASWRAFEARQQPAYPDPAALEAALAELRGAARSRSARRHRCADRPRSPRRRPAAPSCSRPAIAPSG